jgi:tetratricopeptide (TPR) repeat protein
MNRVRIFGRLILSLLSVSQLDRPLSACIWDSDTLLSERFKSPKLSDAILKPPPKPPDPAPLLKRIQALKSAPKQDDPAWWNDLAGAYLRLGQAKEAAELLAPVVKRFPNDYGVHANLGTAYHLLGRFVEAEVEIARDLEINPDAHFGLEKYHLALLQYLVRDRTYRERHVYVDEFSQSFCKYSHSIRDDERKAPVRDEVPDQGAQRRKELEAEYQMFLKSNKKNDPKILGSYQGELGLFDELPSYRLKWNLARDHNLNDGVIYLASLNPLEPACFVMLGVVSIRNRDLNLGAAAYERAIALGSLQAPLLRSKITDIYEHIVKARWNNWPSYGAIWTVVISFVTVLGIIISKLIRGLIRWRHRPSD